jgi:allantoate deiminase
VSTAASVLERCAALGRISEEPDRLVRRYATPAMREAYVLVGGWMRDAGLTVSEDAAGNLIGRRDGPGRTLVLGSHLDTVVDAGRYDGPLGVVSAIAVLERLWDRALPYAVEVIAFADEEGVRFGTSFLGSSAVAGRFAPAWLALEDADGISMADALRAFGGDPDAIASAARRRQDLLAYCEVHIEQGPVLERRGAPVGVVTTITGQTHAEVAFLGEAGHAGTVPMNARRDALAAAAEWMLAVEGVARRRQGTVATVGRIRVDPGARNVIPGEAWMTLDVRHTSNAVRREAIADLRAEAQRIAAAREVELDWDARGETAAVPTSPDLADLLGDAIEAAGHAPERLPSGAGHDAVAMAAITDIAMLFVRCEKGISQSPLENMTELDAGIAIRVLIETVLELARREG